MTPLSPRRVVPLLGLAVAVVLGTASAQANPGDRTTPIQHLVVIFDENISFDHYFATYPNATNPSGQPAFTGAPLAGTIDNLASANLLTSNPNAPNPGDPLPARLDRSVAIPCDQDHGYLDEQRAWNVGLMNQFVQFGGGCAPSINLNYYDGNTVTALWNYANNFAMSDAFRGTTFGPSTPGALNLISGNTHGTTAADSAGQIENNTLIGDPNPQSDDCGAGSVTMTGPNIGDLMTAAGMTWGWFQGGFKPTTP